MFGFIFNIAVVLSSMSPGGDVWLCENLELSSPLYTDTPTSSPQEKCRPSEVASSAFNKVSKQHFYFEVEVPANLQTKKLSKKFRNKVKSKTYLTWKSKELGREKGAKPFDVGCEISGRLKSEKAKRIRIKITRGALTINFLEVLAKKDFQSVSWHARLKGPCRRPDVKIIDD